jgi:hypothetical protein
MEDNLNGRRPKWKRTKIILNVLKRRKTTFREGNLHGRQPEWKMTQIAEKWAKLDFQLNVYSHDLNI